MNYTSVALLTFFWVNFCNFVIFFLPFSHFCPWGFFFFYLFLLLVIDVIVAIGGEGVIIYKIIGLDFSSRLVIQCG